MFAWRAPTGRIHLRARVWSTNPAQPAHVHVRDEILRNEELVEPYIHELAKTYRIREIVFDDDYFAAEANHLARAGFRIAPMFPGSNDMKDAVRGFRKGVDEGTWAHDGDEMLARHLGNCVGITSMVGTKEFDKIGKPDRDSPIDAGTAAVMAGWRCLVGREEGFVGGVEFAADPEKKAPKDAGGFTGGVD